MFILNNNNFQFDSQMWHQLNGTGMGIDFAGPYACLAIGYLEKVKLFEQVIPRMYTDEEVLLIRKAYKRYVDDGILLWPKRCDVDKFIQALNSLNEYIKFTVERGAPEKNTYIITFLDIRIILHQDGRIETEISYKATNNHHYLEYNSFHPKHVKDNIPYGMAKKIIVFTSDPTKEHEALERLKGWFLQKNYPLRVVEKAIHNAKLQGPAPDPSSKKQVIALTSSYSSNYSNKSIAKQANVLLDRCPDDTTRRFFSNKQVIMSYRQPPNILRQVTSAKFDSVNNTNKSKEKGIFLCSRSNCNICRLGYLQEGKSFRTDANVEWEFRSHLTCHSKFVIYFQKCAICNKTSDIGKTNNFRKRTNNHISSCKSGTSSDKFDNHVFNCNKNVQKSGPLFYIWIMMELNSVDKLHEYERHLHRSGHDTMNRGTFL